MAKALKTAALIVGAVALVATGAGAAISAGIIGSVAAGATTATFLGVSAATFAAVGALAGVGAALLSTAAGLAAPKGTLGGSATKFTIDKESGIPYLMGRSASGGRVIHRQYYGAKNVYESWAVVHSLGPVKSIGPLLIDTVAVPQNGTAVGGSYSGYMWLDTQLGACPEARALAGPQGGFPGWDASSKLSGLAADLWTMKFDTKGKVFPEGVPQRLRVLEGVYVYDPRLDSTYPGGAGPCRIGHEETYVWSENPALHAITWAFGRYQNGVLVAGGGLGVWGIDLPPFVEWANVCDLNGWKVGGTVYTTSDNKWDVLKMIAQAGAAEVMPSGALLSVTFSAPRVSIGTITSADIAGDLDIPSTASMRDRRNTIIPRIRLESQGWEVVPLDPIIAHAALALDGASRPKEITYPLIQNAKQAGQVAMYDLLNAREIDGMVIPAKIYALGYRPGDCLTLDISEADLIDRDVIVRTREIDGGTMGVTLTCRSETAGKHAFALGQTGVEPRTPDLSIPSRDVDAPAPGDWALAAGTDALPTLHLVGSVGNGAADAVIFAYREVGTADWIAAGAEPATTTDKVITVPPGAHYEAAVSYRVRGVTGDPLVLAPVTSGSISVNRAAFRIVSQTVDYPVTTNSSSATIEAFDAVLDDGRMMSFPAGSVTGLDASSAYVVFWNLATASYFAAAAPATAQVASSANVLIRAASTSAADGTYPTSPPRPGGDGGGGGVSPGTNIP